MNTFAGILVGIVFFTINFGLYKAMEDLYQDLPKWLKLALIVLPPLAIISLIIFTIVALINVVYDTIKNI